MSAWFYSENMETSSEYSCSTDQEIKDRLKKIVRECAGLKLPTEEIEDLTDLYRAGMSSQASVMLMVAVEAEFSIEFPDAMLSREVFRDIETMASAIQRVQRAER